MILLQVVLIALNAIFACAEIAVISMNDNKLARMAAEGDKRAMRLARLTSEPARFLATIQVAITLSGFLGSAFAAENFSSVLVSGLIEMGVKVSPGLLESIAVVITTLILSYFTLVFGELVPKQVAMRKAETLALGLSSLISAIARVFAPIVWFLTFSTNSILRLFGIDPNQEEENVSEEEIRMMVDVGSEKGTIDLEEKQLIQNIFEFDDIAAEEIATHRKDVQILYIEDSMEQWRELIYNSRHTQFPVCEESADHIVGILDTKVYFRLEDKSRENVMKEAVSDAHFVPDTVRADTLFRNMKEEKYTLAVVLDEYGGMTGIITIHDLVQQLVGNLVDDNEENEVSRIEPLEQDCWQVHGSATIQEISEEIGITLSDEEYDTFNGLVFHSLGCIPADGTDIKLTVDKIHIEVKEIKEHMVETAIIKRLDQSDLDSV
ncbi:MAG: HlyC/CorC family transporter [Lachnospiraceae bacterium]|nr:HlyC/CorC family transporter [Lachnospiraceae bacterium]